MWARPKGTCPLLWAGTRAGEMAPGIKATSAALESWGHLWVLWVKTSCSPQPAMGSTEVGGGCQLLGLFPPGTRPHGDRLGRCWQKRLRLPWAAAQSSVVASWRLWKDRGSKQNERTGRLSVLPPSACHPRTEQESGPSPSGRWLPQLWKQKRGQGKPPRRVR